LVQQTTVTPSRKKRSHHKKKDVHITGPKIRHPPEPVHPNVIFLGIGEGDKADMSSGFARLYQDMIRYSISSEYRNMLQKQKEQGEPIGFTVTEIGYWLLDHNPDYIDYYSDSKSKTPGYIVLANIRQTLKSYLEHLGKWCIVKRLQEVDAETRNGTKTPLYRYGRVAIIIARILEYPDKSDYDGKQEAKNNIFGLIQRMFKDPRVYNAYKADFLAEFYHKLIDYDSKNSSNPQLGLCDGVIRQIISAFKDGSIAHDEAIDYFDHLQTILLKPVGDIQTKDTILGLYLQTLDEVPEGTRKMTMYHDKNFFESKLLMSMPTKDWSKAWVENMTKYDTIVVCGTCVNKECSHHKSHATIVFDYRTYISVMARSADNNYCALDCPACKSQNSLHVYDTMKNFYR
jgi:hypothetical protein